MSELHVLRVFTTPSGKHGNELGVFLAGSEVPAAERQGALIWCSLEGHREAGMEATLKVRRRN